MGDPFLLFFLLSSSSSSSSVFSSCPAESTCSRNERADAPELNRMHVGGSLLLLPSRPLSLSRSSSPGHRRLGAHCFRRSRVQGHIHGMGGQGGEEEEVIGRGGGATDRIDIEMYREKYENNLHAPAPSAPFLPPLSPQQEARLLLCIRPGPHSMGPAGGVELEQVPVEEEGGEELQSQQEVEDEGRGLEVVVGEGEGGEAGGAGDAGREEEEVIEAEVEDAEDLQVLKHVRQLSQLVLLQVELLQPRQPSERSARDVPDDEEGAEGADAVGETAQLVAVEEEPPEVEVGKGGREGCERVILRVENLEPGQEGDFLADPADLVVGDVERAQVGHAGHQLGRQLADPVALQVQVLHLGQVLRQHLRHLQQQLGAEGEGAAGDALLDQSVERENTLLPPLHQLHGGTTGIVEDLEVVDHGHGSFPHNLLGGELQRVVGHQQGAESCQVSERRELRELVVGDPELRHAPQVSQLVRELLEPVGGGAEAGDAGEEADLGGQGLEEVVREQKVGDRLQAADADGEGSELVGGDAEGGQELHEAQLDRELQDVVVEQPEVLHKGQSPDGLGQVLQQVLVQPEVGQVCAAADVVGEEDEPVVVEDELLEAAEEPDAVGELDQRAVLEVEEGEGSQAADVLWDEVEALGGDGGKPLPANVQLPRPPGAVHLPHVSHDGADASGEDLGGRRDDVVAFQVEAQEELEVPQPVGQPCHATSLQAEVGETGKAPEVAGESGDRVPVEDQSLQPRLASSCASELHHVRGHVGNVQIAQVQGSCLPRAMEAEQILEHGKQTLSLDLGRRRSKPVVLDVQGHEAPASKRVQLGGEFGDKVAPERKPADVGHPAQDRREEVDLVVREVQGLEAAEAGQVGCDLPQTVVAEVQLRQRRQVLDVREDHSKLVVLQLQDLEEAERADAVWDPLEEVVGEEEAPEAGQRSEGVGKGI
eukprot:761832-Hanusia_phi.AAC.1